MNLEPILEPRLIQKYLDYLKQRGVPAATIERKLASIKKFSSWIKPQSQLSPGGSIRLPLEPAGGGRWPNNLLSLYQRYTSSRIASYLHLSILVLFTAALAVFGYNQIFQEAQLGQAYPQAPYPKTPNRYLSFQARLTDSSDNPITTPTDVRFIIYNHQTASGSARLWEELRYIDPDQDGIFSVTLGTEQAINSSIFSENVNLWLGVTVETDPEATPRQRIATVGYALNAETLQGFPPSASASADQIPVLTQEGDLVLAAASPLVYSSSGTFAIKGQALAVTTDSGTNGSITLSPDGTGQLLLTTSTTSQNSIRATNANLTSGHLISGYVGNNTATGDLLNLSSGSVETEKFTVDRSGNVELAGDLTISGGNITNAVTADSTLTVTGTLTANGTLDANGQLDLGDGGDAITLNGSSITLTGFNSCTALETNGSGVLSCGTDDGGIQWWRQSLGALSPVNDTLDLLIGANATTSAKFAVINVNSGTPTATISANSGNNAAFLTGLGNLGTTNGQSLTLGGGTAGDILFQPNQDTVDYATLKSDGTNLTLATTDGSALSINPAGELDLTTAGLVDLNAGANLDIDVTGTIDLLGSSTFSIDGTGASNISATSGNLTVSTITSGNLILLADDDVFFQADNDTGDYLTLSSDGTDLTLATTDNSHLTLDPAGTLYFQTTSNSIDATGNLVIAGTLDVNGGDGSDFAGSVTFNDNVTLTQDAAENLAITHTNATADALSLTTTTTDATGLDGLSIAVTAVNGSDRTVNLFNGSLTAQGTGTGDIANGLFLDLAAQAGGTETAIKIQNTAAWNNDIDFQFEETLSNANDDTLIFTGVGGTNNTSLTLDLDGAGTTVPTLIGGASDLIAINDGLSIGIDGATTENIAAAGFALADGNDLYVEGMLGINGAAYFDGAVDMASTLTVAGTFDANGQLDLGDGGDAITLNGSSITLTGFNSCTALETNGSGVLTCGTDDSGGGAQYWRLASGAISPVNDTLDLLIGSTATTSAKFAVINVNSGTPTATISGSTAGNALYLTGDGTIATSKNRSLILNPDGGNVGIGTSNPAAKLEVGGTNSNISNSSGNLTITAAADLIFQADNDTGDYLTLSSDGTDLTLATTDNSHLTLDPAGILYFQSSNSYIDASGNLTLAGDLTISGGNITNAVTADSTLTVTGTLTANGTLDANGQLDLGDGGDAITLNGSSITLTGFNSCTALETNGSGVLSCGTDDGGIQWWRQSLGALSPVNDTLDLLIGANATTSAKFAVINVNSGTPTATISANSGNNAAFLTGLGNLGTTNGQNLTLGGASTGNIILSPASGKLVGFAGGTTYFVDDSGNAKFLDIQAVDTGNPGLTVGDGTSGYLKIGGSTISDAAGSLTLDSDAATTVISDDLAISGGNITTAVTFDSSTTFASTLDANGDVQIADTNIAFDGASTTFTTTGAFTVTPGGTVTIGDSGDVISLAGSDINLTVIDGQTINLAGDGTPTADVVTIAAGTVSTTNVSALSLSLTATNQTNFTNYLMEGSLTAQGTSATDLAYGIYLDLASQAGGTETALKIQDTADWNVDIDFQSEETLTNVTDDLLVFSGVGGTNNTSLTLDLDGAGTTVPTIIGGASDLVAVYDSLSVGIDGATTENIGTSDFAISGGNDLYVDDKLGVNGNASIDGTLYLASTGVVNFGGGNVTLTHSTGNLAIATDDATNSDITNVMTLTHTTSGTATGGSSDTYTKALLHMDGADGTTTFSDDTGKTWTTVGNAQIDTSQSKFGGASGQFDGTGDAIRGDGSADFTFGSGDFTIDFWFRGSASIDSTALYDGRAVSSCTEGFYPFIGVSSGFNLYYYVNSATRITGSTTINNGVWYHLAVTRSGTTTRMFLNGIQEGSSWSDSSSYAGAGSNTPTLGGNCATTPVAVLNGWLDEFRISKGIARWTSTFTPPSSPYTYNTNTGIGTGLLFRTEDEAGNTEDAARIAGTLITATNGAEDSSLVFETRAGGAALTRTMRLWHTGDVTTAGWISMDSNPDVAENVIVTDPTIGSGDVVEIDTAYLPATNSDIYNQVAVKKAATPYSAKVLGIISTDPGLILNSPADAVDTRNRSAVNERPLSLAGRVPVKVSTINGPIAAGDPLTSSDIPGLAMKATETGHSLGKALEDFSCDQATICEGQILTFINLSWYEPPNLYLDRLLDQFISQIINLPQFVAAKIQAGLIEVQTLIAGEKIVSPAVETQQLTAVDATIAGTLTAQQINSSTIDSLRHKIEALAANLNQETAAPPPTIDPNTLNALYQLLESPPEATSSTLTNLALVEADSGFFREYLAVLGKATMTDLKITNSLVLTHLSSPTGQIDLAGNLIIDGNLTVKGQLDILGTLTAPTASFSGLLAEKLTANEAKIDSLITKQLIIAAEASASAAATDSASITTNATAGKAVLPAGLNEYTIYSPHVSSDSLIYVTPTSDPQNQVLYVKAKEENAWFKVAINQPLSYDLEFNWWIIKLE
jgi:cytoskeletal protein CcmA (bactofilin family)